VHYWNRSLWWCTLLGEETQSNGTYSKADGSTVCETLRQTNKTDAADAEAICEAVTRPNMRFVAIKNEEQQAILSLHRARQGFVKARTAQANQIRGLLGEYGITIPQGIKYVMKDMLKLLDSPEHDLPGAFTDLLKRLHAHLLVLEEQVSDLETQINSWHSNNEYSQRLSEIPGIGPLTATALVASIADANCFRNGREYTKDNSK
jgi:transposase